MGQIGKGIDAYFDLADAIKAQTVSNDRLSSVLEKMDKKLD